jgi:hypothetical protein
MGSAVSGVLTWWRTYWIRLTQAAAWLSAALGGFLLPPPEILGGESQPQPWPHLVRFLVAFLCGIVFVLSERFSTRATWQAWLGASVASLVAGGAAFGAYWYLSLTMTCVYRGQAVMTGVTFVSERAREAARGYAGDCAALLAAALGDSTSLWPIGHLAGRQALLASLFALATCSFAVAVMCLLEAMRRTAPARSRR